MQQRVPRDKNRIQESTLRTINPILTTINPILTNIPFTLLPFYPFFFFFFSFFFPFKAKDGDTLKFGYTLNTSICVSCNSNPSLSH